MKKKSKRSKPAPPSPADAHNYTLVQSKEGPYWRRKRGTIKPAALNNEFKKNAVSANLFSPAAKRIKDKLAEFLRGLETGRFIANVSGKLRKAYNQTGEFTFTLLQDYDFQPYHPLSDLLDSGYQVQDEKNQLIVTIPIDATAVKRLNSLITAYYFEIILLYGDPSSENSLKLDSDISPLYTFSEKDGTKCKLILDKPNDKIPWIFILKLSCHEGDSLALHCRHYGMKVVKAG